MLKLPQNRTGYLKTNKNQALVTEYFQTYSDTKSANVSPVRLKIRLVSWETNGIHEAQKVTYCPVLLVLFLGSFFRLSLFLCFYLLFSLLLHSSLSSINHSIDDHALDTSSH